MGIPTYCYSVETTLSASPVEKIGQSIQTGVGHIYGISVSTDGTSSTDSTKNYITLSDTPKLWLVLKYGQAIFVNALRLDHFVYTGWEAASIANGTPFGNPMKYFNVNIPMDTDLKQSYFLNPSKLTNAKTVCLNFFYIDLVAYQNLQKSGMVLLNGLKQG